MASTAYSADYVRDKLAKELKPTHIEVEDLSDGCGGKFNAIIVAETFEGKALLQRHRLVNSILEEELKSIHAFQMRTLTPKQWEEQKQKIA